MAGDDSLHLAPVSPSAGVVQRSALHRVSVRVTPPHWLHPSTLHTTHMTTYRGDTADTRQIQHSAVIHCDNIQPRHCTCGGVEILARVCAAVCAQLQLMCEMRMRGCSAIGWPRSRPAPSPASAPSHWSAASHPSQHPAPPIGQHPAAARTQNIL